MPAVPAIHPLLRVLMLLAATAFPPTATPGDALPGELARAVALLEQQLRRDPRRVDAPALETYLHGILCRLDPARCGELRTLILREPGFNASSAPGGLIVLRTGALLRCQDESELALVLAHELAHERRGDAHERWRRAGAGLDDHRGDVSRGEEAAADALAIAMLASAGYDVDAGERLWTRLLAEEAAGATAKKDISTHPVAGERLAAFRRASPGRSLSGDPVPADEAGRTRFREQIEPYRPAWLDEEVARGHPTATVAMLEAMSDPASESPGLELFALGQALRRRAGRGDRERAATLYVQAVARTDAPPAAWREHGLMRREAGDAAGARAALSHYLAREPAASDADFIAAMLHPGPAHVAESGGPAAPARGGRPAHADVLRVFDLRLPTRLRWTRQRGIGLEQWTLDGLDRNRLLVVPDLRPGEPLFRDAGKGGPTHRAGRRPDEQRDQVVAALDAAGWLDVHADGPRPHAFGAVPGWHANLSLANAAGVRHRGSVIFVERRGRLTLLLWFAAADHDDLRDSAAVEAMLAGATFAD